MAVFTGSSGMSSISRDAQPQFVGIMRRQVQTGDTVEHLHQALRAIATAILDRIIETVRSSWQSTMRRAGVSEVDCEAIARAFLYEGFFYEEAV